MDDDTEFDVSAAGIAGCLQMLAEEAATLKLSRTLLALREALESCEAEGLLPLRSAATLH